ncbi:hypothetical protein ACRAWD_04620 [Caulobacter segnis]
MDARLAEVWPSETKFQKRCFELLRAAYVKARALLTALQDHGRGAGLDPGTRRTFTRHRARWSCEARLKQLKEGRRRPRSAAHHDTPCERLRTARS